MGVFIDPSRTPGVRLLRGVEFIDGRTADVEVSDDTRVVFASYGIREKSVETPAETDKKPRTSRK